MKVRILIVISALITSVLGLTAAPSSATFAGEGSITGAVLGPDGQPVAGGVRVEAYVLRNGTWYSFSSNGTYQDGRFVVDNLQPGDYKLLYDTTPWNGWVSPDAPFSNVASQWFPGTSDFAGATDVTVRADQSSTVPTVGLPTGGHLRGRVVDDTGSRLTGYVNVHAMRLGPYGWQPFLTVRAEADGSYDLPLMGDTNYVVEAYGGQFSAPYVDDTDNRGAIGTFAATYSGSVDEVDDAATLQVAAGQTTEVPTIRAVRNGTLAGTVTDPSGAPLAGAKVTLPRIADRDVVLTTDALGRWDAGPLRRGKYAVGIEDPSGDVEGVAYGSESSLDLPGRLSVSDGEPHHVTTPTTYASPRMSRVPSTGWDTFVPVGTTMRVKDLGAWLPSSTTLSVQWTRNGRAIPGATGETYVVAPEDDGFYIAAQVAATAHGRTTVVDTVDGGEGSAFHESDYDPTIDDTSPVWGQELHAVAGFYEPADASSWQWFRSGVEIPGATSAAYVVTTADHGEKLSVAVRRSRIAGEPPRIEAISQPTSPVDAADTSLSVTARPTGKGTVRLTAKARSSKIARERLDGKVTIARVRSGSDRIENATMHDGELTVTVKHQPKGRRTFYVVLAGQQLKFSSATSSRRTIRVR